MRWWRMHRARVGGGTSGVAAAGGCMLVDRQRVARCDGEMVVVVVVAAAGRSTRDKEPERHGLDTARRMERRNDGANAGNCQRVYPG